jgi:hypothetical protein
MVTDEDFEQTDANVHEYSMYKRSRGPLVIPIYGGYAGSCFCAIASIITFGGTDFGFYIKSALLLYWFPFLFSTLFKTEETFLIDRLNSYRVPRTRGTAWRRWFIFFRRGAILGIIYTILLLIVWKLKL